MKHSDRPSPRIACLCALAFSFLLTACGGGGGGGAGSGSASSSGGASPLTLTATPQDSDELLINPGKGWVLYPPYWPSLKSEAVWTYVSTCYQRYSWTELQPDGKDSFTWTKLENDLNTCKAKGKKLAFGVMSADSNYTASFTPQWLYDLGAKSYTGKTGRLYPVWDDPIYLAYQKKLTDKLAERFDGSEDIAYVDARNYGNWGEWHLSGIGGVEIDQAAKRQLLEMWTVFKHTDVIVPGNTEHYHTQYGSGTLGFGIRCDSSDYWHSAGQLAKDIAPAVSEWSTRYSELKTGSGWSKQVWSDAWIPAYMAGSGYSYDNLGQYDWDSDLFLTEKPELVKTWANRMGYWFRLVSASFPSHLGNGQSGSLTIKVRNDGVAPIFVNKKNSVVKLALLDASNQIVGTPVLLASIHPFDWKPGQTISNSSDFSFPANANARKLAIGLFSSASKTSPDIRFGSQGQTSAGWLVLSVSP